MDEESIKLEKKNVERMECHFPNEFLIEHFTRIIGDNNKIHNYVYMDSKGLKPVVPGMMTLSYSLSLWMRHMLSGTNEGHYFARTLNRHSIDDSSGSEVKSLEPDVKSSLYERVMGKILDPFSITMHFGDPVMMNDFVRTGFIQTDEGVFRLKAETGIKKDRSIITIDSFVADEKFSEVLMPIAKGSLINTPTVLDSSYTPIGGLFDLYKPTEAELKGYAGMFWDGKQDSFSRFLYALSRSSRALIDAAEKSPGIGFAEFNKMKNSLDSPHLPMYSSMQIVSPSPISAGSIAYKEGIYFLTSAEKTGKRDFRASVACADGDLKVIYIITADIKMVPEILVYRNLRGR